MTDADDDFELVILGTMIGVFLLAIVMAVVMERHYARTARPRFGSDAHVRRREPTIALRLCV